jgi:V-type H+-transporting ATPase subunit E
MKLHQAKLRIQQEYKQKQKAAETQRRIQRSVVTSEVRVRKMVAREELVQKVKEQTKTKLTQVATKDANAYSELLKKLIVQTLIKLNESKVEVQCREVDVKIVQKVMQDAATQYQQLIADACKEKVKVEITLSNKSLPGPSTGDGTPSCAGGVKVLAKGGRIICDNTLDSRLNIAFQDLMPVIRQMLFTTPL